MEDYDNENIPRELYRDRNNRLNPHYSSSLRSEGCIYNKISDKTIEAYPLIW